jgi:hypothetical protein
MIHIEVLDDGIRLLIRLPMPLLVADKMGPEQADGSRAPAPYTRNAVENGDLMHYLDPEQLQRDPQGLAQLVAQGHALSINGVAVTPEVRAIRLYPATAQPLFSTLEDAVQALQGPVYPPGAAAVYVGDTIVDTELFYRYPENTTTVSDLALSSSLRPGLPGTDELANLLLYHTPDGATQIYRASGLLHTPVTIVRSPLAAALTFIEAGIQHILEGFDHVLFVLCLTLGALTLKDLLWRITGFTLGHSITLIAGVLGYVPSAAWFIPAVELLIALSIVYAGVVVLVKTATGPSPSLVVVTTAFGLLHGFGFSFVLSNILKIDQPHLWTSLISFNIGVEIGQLTIVLLVWPLLYLLSRYSQKLGRYSRLAVVIPCIAVAALWSGERLGTLLQEFVL